MATRSIQKEKWDAPTFSEHGVPSEAILVEPEGSTTAQSLGSAAEIMHRMEMHSCIVVSDGYHIFRVKRLLEAQGIQVYGSPRPASGPSSHLALQWLYFRQAVGFHALAHWHQHLIVLELQPTLLPAEPRHHRS